MKGKKGKTRNYIARKKDTQHGELFAGYQKTVQDRMKNASVNLDEDLNLIEHEECQVGSQ